MMDQRSRFWSVVLVGAGSLLMPFRDSAEPVEHQFKPEERLHWAFQPVRPPPLPRVGNAKWIHNPIDAFVLAALEEKKLDPASPADKVTLLRRATLDLIGLPPTPEEIQAFV